MFAFDYPWIFLLLPLPWLLRALLPAQKTHQRAVRVPFGERIAQASGRKANADATSGPAQSLIIPCLLWLLVLSALARPQWIEPPITKEFPTRDLLLLVDLSASMKQKDFTNEAGQKVDRLAAVKEVLGEFLERRDGDRVGLVVFGDAPYLQAPFSTDLDLSRRLLDECQVGMAGPRTAFGDAIGLGVNLFKESQAPAKTMIALTDGNDTKSQVPPIEAARIAAQRGIRIYTVAIGDATTVGEDKLDEQALRDVASATGGSYFFAADRKNLAEIYAELDRIETSKVKTFSHRPRRQLYYLPLAAGLLLSLAHTAYLLFSHRNAIAPVQKNLAIQVNPDTGKLELQK